MAAEILSRISEDERMKDMALARQIFIIDQKTARREDLEDGRKEGQKQKPMQQISIKLAKGQAPEQIAEALEEDVDTIQELREEAENREKVTGDDL